MKAFLPVVFHHPSLVLSICPLWSKYQYTLQPDCGLVLLTSSSGILGKVAMQLQAKYLSGHHCVERKVLVSTTVVRGHMSSFILSNKFSRGLMNIALIFPRTKKILVMLKITNCGSATPPGDCIVISNCQYVVNFEFWNVKSRIVICGLSTK